jgi:hypothetical protein
MALQMKYQATSIKARSSKQLLGSQMDHSTYETSNDGGEKDPR